MGTSVRKLVIHDFKNFKRNWQRFFIIACAVRRILLGKKELQLEKPWVYLFRGSVV